MTKMKKFCHDDYEVVVQNFYPPVLRSKDGKEWVLTTQTEIFLCEVVLSLLSRVEVLEKRISLSKKNLPKSDLQP